MGCITTRADTRQTKGAQSPQLAACEHPLFGVMDAVLLDDCGLCQVNDALQNDPENLLLVQGSSRQGSVRMVAPSHGLRANLRCRIQKKQTENS